MRGPAAAAQAAERVLPGDGDATGADGEDLAAPAEGPGEFAAVSSTLSDTGPIPAVGEQPPAAAQARPAVPAAPAPSRPHIIAFDLIRLIIMVFVVGVHTLAWGGGQVTVSLGAVSTVFPNSP